MGPAGCMVGACVSTVHLGRNLHEDEGNAACTVAPVLAQGAVITRLDPEF